MSDARLAGRTWPEIPERPLVLVPVGSHEQHGPHLPFDTDTVVASAVADAIAAELTEDGVTVLVAPALPVGASGEHQGFPGTLSIGHEALALVLVELVRSMSLWAGRMVLVNGHGGNVPTLRATVAQLRAEQHDLAWVACAFESATDAHAGHDETSVMLHLDPSRVRLDRAAPGRTEPLAELLPQLMAEGIRPVAPNGVLGDPTRASAAHGATLVASLVTDLVARVRQGAVDEHGRLVAVAPEVGHG